MRRVPIFSAILVGVVLFGATGASAQSMPRKANSPAEVEQAVNDYNAKIVHCRNQARAQKLHLMKRRRFIRDCVNAP